MSCSCARLNGFSREAPGGRCFGERGDPRDATGHGASERGRAAFVWAEDHPAGACVCGWYGPLSKRGSSQAAAAVGSGFGHSVLLERLVAKGSLYKSLPSSPYRRKITLDHSHKMRFCLKRVWRKTGLSWSALFWVKSVIPADHSDRSFALSTAVVCVARKSQSASVPAHASLPEL